MALISTLVNFIAGTKIVSADVDSNFSAIRNAFNGSAVLNDTANTIAVAHTFTISQNLNAGFTTTTGTATFGAGVTFASGTTITTSGVTVVGGFTISDTIGMGNARTANRGIYVGPALALSGTEQDALFVDFRGTSTATAFVIAADLKAGTVASAFTCNQVAGVFLEDATKGAGSTITTQYGLYVANQTQGGTNVAIKTNTGIVQFGDNVTCAAALNVAGAATFAGGVRGASYIAYQNANLTTTSTTDTSLASFSLPAGTLAADGDAVRITLRAVAATNNADVTLKFGATAVLNDTLTTAQANGIYTVLITRTGATTQRGFAFTSKASGAATVNNQVSSPGETLSGAVTIDFRGDIPAGGTLTFVSVHVEVLRA